MDHECKPIQGLLTTKNYIDFTIYSLLGKVLVKFQGAQKASKALPGDQVQWDELGQRCIILKRISHLLTGVIELISKTKYGFTSRGAPIYLFLPCDRSYPLMTVGCSKRNPDSNSLALVDFDHWTDNLARCLLREELGPVGDLATEQLALLWTYNPYYLSNKKLKLLVPETLSFSDNKSGPEYSLQANNTILPNSTNFSHLRGKFVQSGPEMTFNIDPPGCKDIDDVLSIYQTEDRVELWITIADVAGHVKPNSELDLFARLQGSTCYSSSGKALRPMLPYAYSESACSLIAGKERAGVSLILSYKKGDYSKPLSIDWTLSSVINKKSYSYEEFLTLGSADGIPIDIIKAMAQGCRSNTDPDDCHTWIEAFMLTYNLETAKLLRSHKQGILRKHASADLEQLALYQSWGGDALASLANHSAEYCSANDDSPIHYGLSAQVYCHASSPIRRYADLVNQRILKAIINGSESTEYEISIPWLNQRQKAMKRFERDSFFLDQLDLPNRIITGRILSVDHSLDPNTRYKVWIPAWKRVISWKTTEIYNISPGSEIQLTYYANRSARYWKEKILFRNYQEKI